MNHISPIIPKKVINQLSIIVVLMIVLPSFNFYLNNILLSMKMGSVVILVYGTLILTMLYGIYISAKYHLIKISAIRISLVLFVLGIVSYFLYGHSIGNRLIRPDYNILYSELLFLLFFCLPSLMISSACRDWSLVVKYLTIVSPVIVVMAFYAWYLFGFRTYGDESMNYMTLSYHVLTAGCVCMTNSFRGFKPIYWVTSLVFLFIIVGSGCRGALVCVLLFLILLLYRQVVANPNKKSSKFIKVSCVVLVLSIPIFYMRVVDDLGNMFEKIGVSSRAIEYLDDKSFLSSDSRDNIRKAIFEGVKDNPFGYGLYGDRYVTIKYYQEGSEYAHNIFYEFLADYGVFIGPLLILGIMVLCYKRFKKYKNDDIGLALLLLIPDGFLKLFFSNSYLTDSVFFILIGFLLSLSNTENSKYTIEWKEQ